MLQQQCIRFTLNLSYGQFLKVYQGSAEKISVLADDGRRIEFPAAKLQRFLTVHGINGYFELQITKDNKFVRLEKLK